MHRLRLPVILDAVADRRDQVLLHLGKSSGKSDIVSLSYVRDMHLAEHSVKLFPRGKMDSEFVEESAVDRRVSNRCRQREVERSTCTKDLRAFIISYPQTVRHGERNVVMCQRDQEASSIALYMRGTKSDRRKEEYEDEEKEEEEEKEKQKKEERNETEKHGNVKNETAKKADGRQEEDGTRLFSHPK